MNAYAPFITPAYLEQQRELHARPNGYGGGGYKHAEEIRRFADRRGVYQALDYGCGQGTLAKLLWEGYGWRIAEYDPAIAGKDAEPKAAELIVCTDVLEHVEPELLDDVLADLRRLTKSIAYLVVATRKANKTLADGRNAHLTVQGADWWHEKVKAHWATCWMFGKYISHDVTFRCYV